MSVSAPFVWRCPSNYAIAPFPHPPHRNRTCGFPASGSRTRLKLTPVTPSATPDVYRSYQGCPIPPRPCRFPRRLEPGPLSSTSVTRLHRYYEPLRHPAEPSLTLTGLRLTPCRHPTGLPVLLLSSSCVHAVVTTPAQSTGASFARIPHGWQPSPHKGRVGLRIALFEACSTFTRITACTIAKSLKGPSTPKAPIASLPPRLLRLLPAGAKVAGRDSHPLENSAFSRRTLTFEVSWRQRRGGLDSKRKMGRRPCACWPVCHAVGSQLDRMVRPHLVPRPRP